MPAALTVIRYADAVQVAFGPLSEYRPLVSENCPDLEIRTGIQTARPGYEAKLHWHPYVEILHILDGEAEAWRRGEKEARVTLEAGDTLVIPARTWHSFRVKGDATLRLLGTHLSSSRIVNYEDGTVSVGGSAPAHRVE